MSRSERVTLERSATTVARGGALRGFARRRAALQEELAAAFAAADREMVSILREELAALEAGEVEADVGRARSG